MDDKQYQEQWYYILENFQWDRVEKAMFALDWTWWPDEEPPKVGKIISGASKICEEAWELGCTISSGGFTATIIKNEEGKFLSLGFTVAKWDGWEI